MIDLRQQFYQLANARDYFELPCLLPGVQSEHFARKSVVDA